MAPPRGREADSLVESKNMDDTNKPVADDTTQDQVLPEDITAEKEDAVEEVSKAEETVTEEVTGGDTAGEETKPETTEPADTTDTAGLAEAPTTEATESAEQTEPAEKAVPADETEASESVDALIEEGAKEEAEEKEEETPAPPADELPEEDTSGAKWYVVHTYSGHENKVAAALKQRVESEHLEDRIREVLVPTQEKIEIRSGKKETVKEKIFPGYILVKMILDDTSWLAVRTTQGVTAFIGMGNKPTPIPESEVKSIVSFMTQGAQPTYKQIFTEGDTVKIVDGPFAEFIGKVDNVDKERGKVKVLVSIFGRETPVELDFLQVAKL